MNILRISELQKHGVLFFREFHVDKIRFPHDDDGDLSPQVTALSPDALRMCRTVSTSSPAPLGYFASSVEKSRGRMGTSHSPLSSGISLSFVRLLMRQEPLKTL